MGMTELPSYVGRAAFAAARLTAEVALDLVPGAGQDVARRNAWGAMVRDNGISRQRREVDAFLAAVGPVSSAHGRHPSQGVHAREG
jgi:hypothetical protein